MTHFHFVAPSEAGHIVHNCLVHEEGSSTLILQVDHFCRDMIAGVSRWSNESFRSSRIGHVPNPGWTFFRQCELPHTPSSDLCAILATAGSRAVNAVNKCSICEGTRPSPKGDTHSRCKIWYLISRTVSEDDAHRGNNDDRSVGAFAVKPRAYGAPLCGIGA